jgi:hypothetical protein
LPFAVALQLVTARANYITHGFQVFRRAQLAHPLPDEFCLAIPALAPQSPFIIE